MSLPTSVQTEGLPKSLALAYEALARRFQGHAEFRPKTSWSFHSGSFDPSKAPVITSTHIWLECTDILENQEAEAFASVAFDSKWKLDIVVPDAGTDPFGYDEPTALFVLGEAYQSLYSTLQDRDLDGAAQVVKDYQVSSATSVGGDRRLKWWTATFSAELPVIYHAPT